MLNKEIQILARQILDEESATILLRNESPESRKLIGLLGKHLELGETSLIQTVELLGRKLKTKELQMILSKRTGGRVWIRPSRCCR